MQVESRYTRWLWVILIVGLILRVIYALSLPTVELFYGSEGGDSAWYLANGWGFFSGQPHGWIRNMPFYLSALPAAPFYILYAGIFQQFLPDESVVPVMRLIQCVIGVITAYLAYRIGWRITDDKRVGLIACALLVFHPSFIIESSNIATETFYIFFLTIGLWLTIEYVVDSPKLDSRLSPIVWLILIGIAFGLGTLTRAVLLLFPVGIMIHMLMLGWRNQLGLWFRRGLLLLIVYSAVVLTWTIYNFGMWGTFVIGSNQLMPALWRGAVQNDGAPDENDELLLDNPDDIHPDGCEIDCKYQHSTETYVEQINDSIGGNIGGFITHRLSELASSYLQPHGTTPLGGVSVREGLVNWVKDNRSLDGFISLLQTEGFFIKLIIWIFHYVGILFGLVGIWFTRKSWRLTLPLIGFVVYTTLIHFALLALPRYIFPVEVPLLIFSAVTLVTINDKFRHRSIQLENEGS
jgi:4-amino-4-deoxy-L-arabinose transferase-like glycosyltransferase